MRDAPIFEVTLRKYEPPAEDRRRNLRFFLLSLGLVRPGDRQSPLEVIFSRLLEENGPVSLAKLAKEANITESAARYHMERLKALRLVEGRGEYRLAEGDLSVAFRVFRRYVLEEILDRIAEYAESL